MFIRVRIVFSLFLSLALGVDRNGVNRASTQKDKRAALVVGGVVQSLSRRKRKRKRRKTRTFDGARAFARFSSSLVFFFSVSFATTPVGGAEEEAENRLKRRVSLLNLLQTWRTKKRRRREKVLVQNQLSLSLHFFASSSAPVSSFRCCCREYYSALFSR